MTFGFDGPAYSGAIDRLAERHAGNIKVGHAAAGLSGKASPSAEKLLRAVIEKNPDPPHQGTRLPERWAALKLQSERVRSLREDPEAAKRWRPSSSRKAPAGELRPLHRRGTPTALMKEAETVLERTAGEFGDCPTSRAAPWAMPPGPSWTRSATSASASRRRRSPARTSTAIRSRLSDFRGKVVVLSFWADWCGSGRGMYPYERSLVDRMRGKPFVLLGVNGDGDRDQAPRADRSRRASTGGRGGTAAGAPTQAGPIARRYNVHAWPTLYVLDHRGVIRHKSLGFPGPKKLDSILDALVKAADDEAKTPRKDGRADQQ